MPSEEVMQNPNFDESGKPGFKNAVQKMVVWYDLKNYRRYVQVFIGWSKAVPIHTGFQVIVGRGVAVLGDSHPIPRKFYEEQLAQAKKENAYAALKHPDKDPKSNEYENELILEFGRRAIFGADDQPVFNIVKVPDSVKSRFIYE